jgi:tRNA1Val (adenine37-N6)-methyltransferase
MQNLEVESPQFGPYLEFTAGSTNRLDQMAQVHVSSSRKDPYSEEVFAMPGGIMRKVRRDELMIGGLTILQCPEIAFSLDAVLLANFVDVRAGDEVLDLGTGTGVIPLLIAAKTEARRVVGLELIPEVARLAERNVRENALTDRIEIIEGDLREASLLFASQSFQVVTANPPYYPVGSGKMPADPWRAAARHEVHCTLAEVVRAAGTVLPIGGRFAMVVCAARASEAREALERLEFGIRRYREVHPRQGGPASLVMMESVAGGWPAAEIEPPLVVYQADGAYSPELRRVFDGEARLSAREW